VNGCQEARESGEERVTQPESFTRICAQFRTIFLVSGGVSRPPQARVCERFGVSAAELATARRRAVVEARDLFLYAAVRSGGLTLTAAARHLRVSVTTAFRALALGERMLAGRRLDLTEFLEP
jgi:hypothetical protein